MGAADSDAVSPPAVFLPDLRTLHAARALADKSDRNLMSALVELTRAEPRALVHAMAARLDLLVIETAGMLACVPVFESVPLHKAMKRHSVLLRDASGLLFGVVADPFDLDLQTWLESCAGRQLPLRLALQEDIDACLSKFEESTLASEGLGNKDTAPETDSRAGSVLSLVALNESSSPAVKLVNSLLYDALKAGASDIHIESTPSGFSVKFRIDGVLDHALTVGGVETAEHVVSRLKVLAELDISERRIPQDGSFMVKSGVRDIDLRLSIMPSIHGEDAVIRVLDKRAMVEAYGALTLDALGFDANSLAALRRMAREPYGMLLVTGPTGSGKTTTLYGALTEIHDGRSKIITIEDPVEYQLPGILQIPVNEKKGLTFARGLRSILRHDPDKIMVGEIRDHEKIGRAHV